MTCPAGCEPGFEREGRLEVSPKRHHSAHPHQAARRSEAMECKTGPPAPERSRAARSRCRWLQSRRGATEAGAAAEPARTAGERGAEQAGMSTSFRSVMSERAELVCGRMGENLVTTRFWLVGFVIVVVVGGGVVVVVVVLLSYLVWRQLLYSRLCVGFPPDLTETAACSSLAACNSLITAS